MVQAHPSIAITNANDRPHGAMDGAPCSKRRQNAAARRPRRCHCPLPLRSSRTRSRPSTCRWQYSVVACVVAYGSTAPACAVAGRGLHSLFGSMLLPLPTATSQQIQMQSYSNGTPIRACSLSSFEIRCTNRTLLPVKPCDELVGNRRTITTNKIYSKKGKKI